MSHPNAKDDMRFDVRVIEHAMRRNQLTRAEYEQYLASLPDDAEEGEEIETVFAETYGRNSAEEATE